MLKISMPNNSDWLNLTVKTYFFFIASAIGSWFCVQWPDDHSVAAVRLWKTDSRSQQSSKGNSAASELLSRSTIDARRPPIVGPPAMERLNTLATSFFKDLV